MQNLLLPYTQAFITQIEQTVACNRAHPIDGRLSKWLLMCGDRSHLKDLKLTQEFISQMLGSRWAGITETAIQLQSEGLISYRRGYITITDQKGLEARSCECYPILKKEFHRLVGCIFRAIVISISDERVITFPNQENGIKN